MYDNADSEIIELFNKGLDLKFIYPYAFSLFKTQREAKEHVEYVIYTYLISCKKKA